MIIGALGKAFLFHNNFKIKQPYDQDKETALTLQIFKYSNISPDLMNYFNKRAVVEMRTL